ASMAAIELLLDRYARHQQLQSVDPTTPRLFLRLFVSALLPYLRHLQLWLKHGQLARRGGELIISSDETVELGGEEYWERCFSLAPEAMPRQLRSLAPAVLKAGKSRHLLSTLPSPPFEGEGEAGPRGVGRGGEWKEGEVEGEEGEGGGNAREVSHASVSTRGGGGEKKHGRIHQEENGRGDAETLELKFCRSLLRLMRGLRCRGREGLGASVEGVVDGRMGGAVEGAEGIDRRGEGFDRGERSDGVGWSAQGVVGALYAGKGCDLAEGEVMGVAGQELNGDRRAASSCGRGRFVMERAEMRTHPMPSNGASTKAGLPRLVPSGGGWGGAEGRGEVSMRSCTEVRDVVRSSPALEANPQVLLLGEPSLLGVTCDSLFSRLKAHGRWRKQLPDLCLLLHDQLVVGGLTPQEAALFSFQLHTPGAQCTDSASGPSASLGLDSHDITALDALRIHFTVTWPLPLTLSQSALGKMEQACRGFGMCTIAAVFTLLLQLRRAKWSLETIRYPGDKREVSHSQHAWRLLQAEMLHFVTTLYTHLTLAVIQVEWTDFCSRLAALSDVDSFREAHDLFASRVHDGCLLGVKFEPLLQAVRSILNLALRLREQVMSMSASGPPSAAERWRFELRRGVRFALRSLRVGVDCGPRAACSFVDLCRCLDFNRFYGD
ncbi:MAG: hypothetical protein SGPRY_005300, partial [Prymnesium sp.]